MSNRNSDYTLFLNLNSNENSNLTALEVYKGCAIAAVNGLRIEIESQLNPLYQELLEIRRLIYFSRINSISSKINLILEDIMNNKILFQLDSPSLIKGDLKFLSGMIASFKGDNKKAGNYMDEAALDYLKANDQRRFYKSLVNKYICISNTSKSYQSGELYALNENCQSMGYYDISGNIYRSYALELLIAGNLPYAIEMALKAQNQYQKECFFDDYLISKSIEGICESLLLNLHKAKNLFFELDTEMFRTHRKTKEFYVAFKYLLEGKVPNPSSDHPLARVPWSKLILKKGSLKAQLIEVLKDRPYTRVELILKLWGENATHESYNKRFHALLNEARSSSTYLIHFDGEMYSIL